jgi:hypothetical protein
MVGWYHTTIPDDDPLASPLGGGAGGINFRQKALLFFGWTPWCGETKNSSTFFARVFKKVLLGPLCFWSWNFGGGVTLWFFSFCLLKHTQTKVHTSVGRINIPNRPPRETKDNGL